MAYEAKYLFLDPLTGVPEREQLPDFLGRIHTDPLQPLSNFRPDGKPQHTNSTRPIINCTEDVEWLINKAHKRNLATRFTGLLDAWWESRHLDGPEANAKTVRVYTLCQEEDYFEELMKDNEVCTWVRGHLDSGTRLFMGVGLISVLYAKFEVLKAIQAATKPKISFSDLTADAMGIEELKRLKVDVDFGSSDSDFKLLGGSFIEEHLIGIQYREVTYKQVLHSLFQTPYRIIIQPLSYETRKALVVGGEQDLDKDMMADIDKWRAFRERDQISEEEGAEATLWPRCDANWELIEEDWEKENYDALVFEV